MSSISLVESWLNFLKGYEKNNVVESCLNKNCGKKKR